jgi:hypothetical protein
MRSTFVVITAAAAACSQGECNPPPPCVMTASTAKSICVGETAKMETTLTNCEPGSVGPPRFTARNEFIEVQGDTVRGKSPGTGLITVFRDGVEAISFGVVVIDCSDAGDAAMD